MRCDHQMIFPVSRQMELAKIYISGILIEQDDQFFYKGIPVLCR